MKALVRLLPLYLGVGLNALATVFSIPVMISAQGLDAWTPIGVGQTVGSVIAPLLGLGWAVTGPAAIARADAGERGRIYRDSLLLRLICFTPTLGAGAIVAASLASDNYVAAIVGMASGAIAAIDASFFYLGTGQLWHVFTLTFAPRFLGTIAGCATIIFFDAPAVAVPCGILVGGALGTALASTLITRSHPRPAQRTRTLFGLLRGQTAPVVSGLAGSIFLLVPTACVSVLAPATLSAFVLYDRLTKQVLTLGAPLFTFLQGWVPRGSDVNDRSQRMRRAFQLTSMLALAVLMSFALLGGSATSLLSAGQVKAGLLTSIVMGLAVALSLFESLVSRIALVVSDRVRAMSSIAVIGSALGTVAVTVLTYSYGATGALCGIALGMAIRVAAGIVVYRRTQVR